MGLVCCCVASNLVLQALSVVGGRLEMTHCVWGGSRGLGGGFDLRFLEQIVCAVGVVEARLGMIVRRSASS